jgi:hypothetical protein
VATVPPIVTGAELVAWLGGAPDPAFCDLIASAVSDGIAVMVDPLPVDDAGAPVGDWSDAVKVAGRDAGARVFKATRAPGGGYAMDEFTSTVEFAVTSALFRRYDGLLAPVRAVGGMIG